EHEDREFGDVLRGWKHRAALAGDKRELELPGHTLVARNVRLADMNIDAAVSDDRRIEVVANKLSSWQGAQQAVDATIITIVSPLSAPLRGRVMPGAVRRKRHQTHPELVRTRRCRFVVAGLALGLPPGSGWSSGQRALETQVSMRLAARAAWVARW
ncbi:unnamed protein product, partial [Symbiodinium sp. KB8]